MSIQRYGFDRGTGFFRESTGGAFVKHADHISANEYDEVIELKKFFDVFGSEPAGVLWNQAGGIFITHFLADRINFDYCNKWMGWKACAKSRTEQ